MRILITNDDSIYSEGLWILAEAAKPYGEVVVVAPKMSKVPKVMPSMFVPAFPLKFLRAGSGF